MKHLYTSLLLASCSLFPLNLPARSTDLLPRPQQMTLTEGAAPFCLGRNVSVDDPTKNAALRQFLTDEGCTITDGAEARVTVKLVDQLEAAYDYRLDGFENEAYHIDISDSSIAIQAVTPTGVLRAVQTLVQLAEGYDGKAPELEALSMTDWPAFKLRGWMQDVGRSFLSIDELKREINLLSRFKVNVFHWHLTEKLAWRFEVKAYPQLTDKKNMVRYAGQYYTQKECHDLEEYAAQRGVTVIPEIDMPGHSDVFTHAMGFDMQSEKGREALKKILDEVGTTFPHAPYIHIGGDEVALKDGFLEEMASYVRTELKRRVVVWNPLANKSVTSRMADMTQMWSTRGNVVKGMPNIDCRYNYTNHFDVYADLVGIYKSNIYYAQQGSPDIAGTISAAWNDTKTATENDIIVQNNQYANILASAERAWIGGGRQYVETGGTKLPNSGKEYEEFADFERRFLFHKAHSLSGVPIAYVKQSNVRWRITDPFPNGGDATLALPPEQSKEGILPQTFTYEGTTYRTRLATGAGIYLRHIWHPTVPSFLPNPANNQTAYAWTYVYSPEAQDVGAQIEFYTYSRSGSEYAPKAGQWDRRGSRIWLNGMEIPAPKWDQTDCDIPQDDAIRGLKNENLTARQPVALHLEKGWNKVFMKLPHANSGGTKRDKWQFTFVITDTEGRNAVDGLVYSPDQSFEAPEEEGEPKLSNEKETYWYQFNTPLRDGYYPTSMGVNKKLMGKPEATTASEWKFQERPDGSFDIINRENGTYVNPFVSNSSALTTPAKQPKKGWNFKDAATAGHYIIVCDTKQFNQANAGKNYQILNWGDGKNTTDTGCQFAFTLVAHEHNTPQGIARPTVGSTPKVRLVGRRIVCDWPYRLYSADGRSLPIGRELEAGTYLVQTIEGSQKVVVR